MVRDWGPYCPGVTAGDGSGRCDVFSGTTSFVTNLGGQVSCPIGEWYPADSQPIWVNTVNGFKPSQQTVYFYVVEYTGNGRCDDEEGEEIGTYGEDVGSCTIPDRASIRPAGPTFTPNYAQSLYHPCNYFVTPQVSQVVAVSPSVTPSISISSIPPAQPDFTPSVTPSIV